MKGQIFAIDNQILPESSITGDCEKHILVVIDVIEVKEQTFANLIKAINLDLQKDVALLILENSSSPIDLTKIIDEKNISKIISFGFPSTHLGFNLNHAFYHNYRLENIMLLFSESIEVLDASKEKKMKLWNSLKLMFPT